MTTIPLGMAPGHVNTDSLQVHPDECVELVAHHLRLAALFYQSTPEDLASVNSEILRIITLKTNGFGPDTQAAANFIEILRDYYTEQKASYNV